MLWLILLKVPERQLWALDIGEEDGGQLEEVEGPEEDRWRNGHLAGDEWRRQDQTTAGARRQVLRSTGNIPHGCCHSVLLSYRTLIKPGRKSLPFCWNQFTAVCKGYWINNFVGKTHAEIISFSVKRQTVESANCSCAQSPLECFEHLHNVLFMLSKDA